MEQRNINIVIGLVILTGFLVWINITEIEFIYGQAEGEPPIWASTLFWQGDQQRSIKTHRGLDLQGGLQVVLEAEEEPAEGVMDAARSIVENRVNGLGVTEPLVQLQGDKRIIVELPGIDNPELAISTIRETGLLEFVDAGTIDIPEGVAIRTSRGDPKFFTEEVEEGVTEEEGATATEEGATEAVTEEASAEAPQNVEVYRPDQIYETIITGSELNEVSNAGLDPTSRQISIPFSLNSAGAEKFGDYSGRNINNYLC
ncbi:hypothetical protein QUF58_10065, partial [Anaerolineales bacterium HSG24]|nr:hypothetical protein [Anaerolineales bacterium HSG24]